MPTGYRVGNQFLELAYPLSCVRIFQIRKLQTMQVSLGHLDVPFSDNPFCQKTVQGVSSRVFRKCFLDLISSDHIQVQERFKNLVFARKL